MLKRVPLPLPSSHGGEAGDTGEAGHDLRNDVASLVEGLSWMGTKCPSDSCNAANHCPNDLCHLSISKITPPTKIRIHIRVTLGEGEVTSPYLPMHGVVC